MTNYLFVLFTRLEDLEADDQTLEEFLAQADGHRFVAQELRLVLLGISGTGKSSSGNSIIGMKVFRSGSATSKCQKGTASRFGHDIEVVDTPGLLNTALSEEEVMKEIMKSITMSASGPHAFVMVLKIKRFTPDEQATIQLFRELFGKQMIQYLFLLFTGLDDLEDDNKTLEDFVHCSTGPLQQLIQECDRRYTAINNRERNAMEKERQVKKLIDMILSNVKRNGGQYFTTERLAVIGEEVRKRGEKLRQEQDKSKRNQRIQKGVCTGQVMIDMIQTSRGETEETEKTQNRHRINAADNQREKVFTRTARNQAGAEAETERIPEEQSFWKTYCQLL
ncbi:GTPase IMAP family member 4-like [Gigantopelta aegis]|uniref:GTPase IMAP family member 4-like n=1 Tax=Gigantopelta aegis TaxID=1735272 RepID=UPI001B88A0E9|nr:GTPase IMAP family member 4-like [Gigantopelta aegis]